jgi:hypothetical protein
VVETLPTHGAYPALRERVRLRRPDGRLHNCQSFRSEDLVEAAGELGVSISEQDVLVIETSGDRQVPRLLSDPGASRADWSNSRRGPPCRELDEEQDVEGLQEHGLQGEEVACDHSPPLCSQELGPGRARPPRRRPQAGTPKDPTDGARAYSDPELAKLALDPDAAPPRVLPTEACDQLDGLRNPEAVGRALADGRSTSASRAHDASEGGSAA